ncbi:hypothetical protein [Roseomonas xinghualingensis]|uniref:hypothetical protein n=1 Tax=Roseomonas xinghualingensis TaxID=2986475 RepID=UPI0021F1E67C|nr:hypothetical protein [Roseomonas sp. SXEYE001]MCV4209347.1 hypothetical protein [Roseomonas sp. SXEYE001]
MSVPATIPPEPRPIARDLVKEIAMDIGKAVAEHIERMYPKAVEAASSTFLLSVRNCTHNEIMAALETTDENAIRARLARRQKDRRELRRMYRAIRADWKAGP